MKDAVYSISDFYTSLDNKPALSSGWKERFQIRSSGFDTQWSMYVLNLTYHYQITIRSL